MRDEFQLKIFSQRKFLYLGNSLFVCFTSDSFRFWAVIQTPSIQQKVSLNDIAIAFCDYCMRHSISEGHSVVEIMSLPKSSQKHIMAYVATHHHDDVFYLRG